VVTGQPSTGAVTDSEISASDHTIHLIRQHQGAASAVAFSGVAVPGVILSGVASALGKGVEGGTM
jgi:hypothetical protein